MKLEAEDCPFVFAFFESCEVLREAIKCLQNWLTVANEYSNFLNGEMDELQQRRNKIQHKVITDYSKSIYQITFLN